MRLQRRREERVTPRIRETRPGDSPPSTSATARRRRLSNSAAVPSGLILHCMPDHAQGVFSRAVLSNPKRPPEAVMNEDTFLEAICARHDPDDYRVFADWLEEQGDPRA